MRACPVVQQIKTAYCKQKAEKQRVPDSGRGCHMVPEGARGCREMEVARGYQRLGWSWPQDARCCQRGQIGVAPRLGKTSDLTFVTVSIAGVEVVALVVYRCHNLLLQVGMVPEMEGPPGRRDKIEGEDYWRWP